MSAVLCFFAGETLPLATSNQIMLRFSAKSGPSAKGFHFVYQGKQTLNPQSITGHHALFLIINSKTCS